MCCLFGVYDYKGGLTSAQKRRLISALATASEVRGTDATGIAYNSEGGRARRNRFADYVNIDNERPLGHIQRS